ncbi:hypothetical protein DL765_005135 [Monosporascus sp. GIB2]|nr:hypothetical protein DL765_005135 [Monosporascus sp. GIB2]
MDDIDWDPSSAHQLDVGFKLANFNNDGGDEEEYPDSDDAERRRIPQAVLQRYRIVNGRVKGRVEESRSGRASTALPPVSRPVSQQQQSAPGPTTDVGRLREEARRAVSDVERLREEARRAVSDVESAKAYAATARRRLDIALEDVQRCKAKDEDAHSALAEQKAMTADLEEKLKSALSIASRMRIGTGPSRGQSAVLPRGQSAVLQPPSPSISGVKDQTSSVSAHSGPSGSPSTPFQAQSAVAQPPWERPLCYSRRSDNPLPKQGGSLRRRIPKEELAWLTYAISDASAVEMRRAASEEQAP